jgi:hypothetical protein
MFQILKHSLQLMLGTYRGANYLQTANVSPHQSNATRHVLANVKMFTINNS